MENKTKVLKKKLEEEVNHRQAVETHFRGSHIRASRLTKENTRLRAQITEMENLLVMVPLPECEECDGLIRQCKLLEGQFFKKDVMIHSFAKGQLLGLFSIAPFE